MTRLGLSGLLALGLGVIVGAQAPAQAPRLLSLDAARQIVRVADPQMAPDGRSVLVAVSRADAAVNQWRTGIVAVDVRSGAERNVAPELEGVSQARWSPRGDRIAVVAAGAGGSPRRQVWIVPAAGGAPREVTAAPEGVLHCAWRPDGEAIAFVTSEPRVAATGPDRFNDGFEVGNDHYLTTAPPQRAHVWVVELGTARTRRITQGDWSVRTMLRSPGLSWSADGASLAFIRFPSASPGDSDRGTIQIVDARTGETRALTGRQAGEGDAHFAPAGVHVAYTWPKDDNPANGSEAWVASGPPGDPGRVVSGALDRDVSIVDWSADGRSLLLMGPDRTRVALWRQELDGRARTLDLGPLMSVSGVSTAPGGAMAMVGSEASRPAELYVKDTWDDQPRRLTDYNHSVAALALGRTERVAWTNADGLPGDGVVTWPPDARPGERRPMVLVIHGGPTAASNEGFSLRAQLLAAQGWVVFQPNYRGSNNLGHAYQRAMADDAAEGPGRDVMAGIDAAIARGGVDGTRLAVSGWSYGGFMTAWLIGRYPDRWRAAVAGAAPVDLTDMSSLTDLNRMPRHAITASPWVGDNLRRALEMSPLLNLPKIRTPTLILSNTGDVRVVVTGSYKLMQALKANGVPVQFVAYPIGGHSPADPVRQMDVERRWIEWLRRHL